MTKKPEKSVVQAWSRLIRAHRVALSKVEKSLKDSDLPPLAWYDVLLELQRAGRKGVRPFELEGELLLPQYGLSRLLERMVLAGYVERKPHKEDRRGHVLAITPAGREIRRRMWPIYGAAIESAVGARLTDQEAVFLAKVLEKLLEE